ncbi:TGB1 [Pepper virus A]|uniref:TGB1 n=1 Tax=Pepper virus A TaxID=1803898 RepID=A0A1W5KTS4_9VIRU|nr:TGB1 [Pepper virus A]AMX81290.1 TGB1 [Pepper virus A]AOY34822.1 TGB1 [Pepper virus A]
MLCVINKLVDCGFSRVGPSLNKPLIINCVPGGGKTTIIRQLLEEFDHLVAYTTASPDPINLKGNQIKALPATPEEGKLVILDEYQNLAKLPDWVDIAFGDPLQSCNPNLLSADFLSYRTHRFGRNTCGLLGRLGFRVESDLEDSVVFEGLFEGELEGQILCCEQEVEELLTSHSVEFLTPRTAQGKTFEVVTFCCSERPLANNLHLYLICLTRHTSKLRILNPEGAAGFF